MTEPSDLVAECVAFPVAAETMERYFVVTAPSSPVPLVATALAGLLHGARLGDAWTARDALREAVLLTSDIVALQRLRDVRRVPVDAPRGTAASFGVMLGAELAAAMDGIEGDELRAMLEG